MGLSHNGYTFLNLQLHGDVRPGDWDRVDVRGQFFGVEGESEIAGSRFGRELSLSATMDGYSTARQLVEDFESINAQTNQITDKTLEVSGNLSMTYEHCTFKGVTRDRIIKNAVDETYLCRIQLRWRQLTPATA